MLFKILLLFGIGLPAIIAKTRVDIEERFDLAKDGLEQAARAAAFLTLLFFLASVTAVSAFGVGLIALYRWVSIAYGEFYGLAVICGILFCVAVAIFAGFIRKWNSWPNDSASRAAAKKLELAQVRAERIAGATAAIEGPDLPHSSEPPEANTTSGLIDPLMSVCPT